MSLAEQLSPDSRSAAATWLQRVRRPERSPAAILLIVLFWAGVALVAGFGAWLGSRLHGGRPPWTAALASPMLAAACWVPITVATLWLARRFPLGRRRGARSDGSVDRGDAPAAEPGARRRSRWLPRLVHGVAALSVSFVLNLGWAAALAAVGELDPASVSVRTMAGGVRWLHVNAAVYLLLVGLATVARSSSRADALPEGCRRLRVGSGGRSTLLEVDEIDWIEGAGDYACIHCGDREYLSSRRLKELEALLGTRGFARIHRSSIVNVGRIRRLRHLSHGDYEAELQCGTVLRVSRRRRRQLARVLERRTVSGEGAPR